MYKSSKGLFSPNITELFGKKNQHQYNLRHNSEYPIPAVNSVYHGNERISLLGPKIYNILPDRLEKIDSLGAFKTEIKVGSLINVRVDSAGNIFTMLVLYR